jgi:tRNA (guanine-N7-)-methyltransferase
MTPTFPSMPSHHGAITDYVAVLSERRSQLRRQLAEIVPPGRSFVWEIGCGHGHFLTAYAAAHPTSLCLGVDIASDRIGRGQRKQKRARLDNLHFLHADAEDFLAALPVGAVFSALFVLFPDPWPKRRHHKHRLLNPGFLERSAERAGRGSRLYFRTDFAPYYQDTRELLRERSDWRLADEPWPFETATVFQERAPHYQSLIAVRQ